jgi:hypothetical protein
MLLHRGRRQRGRQPADTPRSNGSGALVLVWGVEAHGMQGGLNKCCARVIDSSWASALQFWLIFEPANEHDVHEI